MSHSNSPHILCVNPWIHDFAAFDFWAKPLGLLQLAAIIREGGASITFLDCLDRFHPEAVAENSKSKIKVLNDGRGPFRKKAIPLPEWIEISERELSSTKRLSSEKKMFAGKSFSRYGIEPDWFRQDLKRLTEKKQGKPDLVLVTSLMTYWGSGVRETISVIKEILPDVPVVLGGIYATLCTEHAARYSMADEVTTGRGEDKIYDIVRKYTGFSLKSAATISLPSHENREPGQSLTNHDLSLPPIDSGAFPPFENLDSLPCPALDLVSKLTYIPVMTSRGCPFTCTYCASSFLEPQMRRRSPESVFEEIRYWHRNYDVSNIAFYDDALLVSPEQHILPLLEKLIVYCSSLPSSQHSYSSESYYGGLRSSSVDIRNSFHTQPLPLSFHTPNALHIRQITQEVADMMFRAGFMTIRLGLETTDFSASRKEDIKVRENEFHNAVKVLKRAGFMREQIGAYLLCALPGQNPDDVRNSIVLVRQAGIMPVLAYYTPIPHTPMWKQAVSHSRFDLEKEPFFTNNALFPCIDNEHGISRILELKKMAR